MALRGQSVRDIAATLSEKRGVRVSLTLNLAPCPIVVVTSDGTSQFACCREWRSHVRARAMRGRRQGMAAGSLGDELVADVPEKASRL